MDSTKTSISSNTLKRVWGRITYSSKPSDITLNTLSQFLGFEDFRDFSTSYKEDLDSVKAKNEKKDNTLSFWPSSNIKRTVIFVSVAVLMLVAFMSISNKLSSEKVDPDDFYLTSRKVTEGLPNSVIFEYRADKAPIGAKVEIQQSWDTSKRQEVSALDSFATSIYYQPGFFKSKLVVNGQIVTEHDVFIPSNGWCASTKKNDRHLYFDKTDILGDSAVSVSKALLLKNGIDAGLFDAFVDYRFVENFPGLRLDDLSFSATIKNDVNTGQNVCQNTFIVLLLEGQVISIPLSKLGCMAELDLWFLDRTISGKKKDMSKFGVDFDDWVTVDFASKNNSISILVNGEEAINLPLSGKSNKFYGFAFSFEGTGSIKALNLSNSKRTYLDLEYPKRLPSG